MSVVRGVALGLLCCTRQFPCGSGAGQPVLDDLVGPVVARDVLSFGVMAVVVTPLARGRDGCFAA
jgi:hypothetical protein